MMDRLDRLEKMPWSSNSGPAKGPKRLATFCVLGILLPILCLCVPLYMRFQALKPYVFMLTPSEMKLLNHESRISTVWCEGQELRMNGSFNAYLLPKRPKLRHYRQHVTMKRKMILEDDVKEFWGFYLLRGSTVRVSTCSRHEGASFSLIKDLKNAKRCSYLGELDSAEESDEISEEFEFDHDINEVHKVINGTVVVEERRDRTEATDDQARYQKVNEFISTFHTMDSGSKQVLVKKLLQSLGQDPNSEEKLKDAQVMSKFFAFKVQNKDEGEDDFVGDDVDPLLTGGEVFDEGEDSNSTFRTVSTVTDDVYHLVDQGRFNQHNPNDKSREETRSSWSSSEEALAACEGLIYNIPLNGNRNCSSGNAHIDERIMEEVDYYVPTTGFYYFIFANENEITANFIRAHFDMHKTVFDVSSQVNNCTNASSCVLPLKFWSEDHVVLEIPGDQEEQDTDDQNLSDPCYEESLVKGYSSHMACNSVIVAESVCKPRKPVFMIFILMVPVLILIFAYI